MFQEYLTKVYASYSPSPGGRGDKALYLFIVLSPPTLTLPHQGGGNKRFFFFKVFLKRKIRGLLQQAGPVQQGLDQEYPQDINDYQYHHRREVHPPQHQGQAPPQIP